MRLKLTHKALEEVKLAKAKKQNVEGSKQTNASIAEEAGVSVRTVGRFFQIKYVSSDSAFAIILALGLDPSDLEFEQYRDDSEEIDTDENENFYIERPPIEAQCYKEIQIPGSLLRIKAPQGFGKTELLTKILKEAKSHGCRTVKLSFSELAEDQLRDISPFLSWFCNNISEKLGISPQSSQELQNINYIPDCKNYFQQNLLSEFDCPLVLGLDVVDRIFSYPIAVEFLGMLRSWHEEAKSYPVWGKLRVVIVHSTEVYIPMNAEHSPFNVGIEVELPEFNLQQIHDLAQRRQLNWDTTEVKQLMNIVGGHPKLINLAINKARFQPITINKLLEVATQANGIYHNHLQEIWNNLQQYPDLVDGMKTIVNATQTVKLEDEIEFKLYSMGLVKLDNEVKPRCTLYQQYFSRRFRSI